jgi:hypothetical protein
MNNYKRVIVVLVTGILIGAYSCKSTKEISAVALQKMSKEERLNTMIASELQYNTFSSNLKFNVVTGKQKKEISVDAQLRIIKNEAIQLSLRIPLLGSEAFRIVITPDQALIIDRINRQYLSESMINIKAQAPFDFDYYSFEALLTNRLFIAGKKEITPENYVTFKMRENDFSVDFIHTDKQGIAYDFTSDYSHRIQSTLMNQEKWNSQLQCKYSDWGFASNRNHFPLRINLNLNIPTETYTVNLSFKSVDINTEFKIDSNAPTSDKYRPITLQQVMKLIKNLL